MKVGSTLSELTSRDGDYSTENLLCSPTGSGSIHSAPRSTVRCGYIQVYIFWWESTTMEGHESGRLVTVHHPHVAGT